MRQNILRAFLLTVVLALGFYNICMAKNKAAVIDGEPLVLRFDKGKTIIDDADKAKIKQLMDDYKLTQGVKILVIGHTDSSGNAQENIWLSIERAQAVRRQLIAIIGGDVGKDILAIGRGSDNPVADNGTQQGRSQNRRVEIYLAQVISGQLLGKNHKIDPNKAVVEKLVQDARVLLRRKQPQEALRVLREASAQGGDQFSSWNAVFGITGYYTGMVSGKVRSYLSAALELDPFNQEARDYLGRLEARDKVAAGMITPNMGRTPKDAIAILSDAQAHEYLQLFGVRAISHDSLGQGGIVAWRCRDVDGKIVVYHFDRSGIFESLFDQVVPVGQLPDRSFTPTTLPLVSSSIFLADTGNKAAVMLPNFAGAQSEYIGNLTPHR